MHKNISDGARKSPRKYEIKQGNSNYYLRKYK